MLPLGNLSTVQQCLWQMRQAVSEGHCPCDLALRKLRPLNYLRWFTTANKIIRLYVGLAAPSKIHHPGLLPNMVSHTTQKSCNDGAIFPHAMMVKTWNLSYSKESRRRIIQRNSFWSLWERAISHDHWWATTYKANLTQTRKAVFVDFKCTTGRDGISWHGRLADFGRDWSAR